MTRHYLQQIEVGICRLTCSLAVLCSMPLEVARPGQCYSDNLMLVAVPVVLDHLSVLHFKHTGAVAGSKETRTMGNYTKGGDTPLLALLPDFNPGRSLCDNGPGKRHWVVVKGRKIIHCSRCNRDLEEEFFHKASRRPNGHASFCKKCFNQSRTIYDAKRARELHIKTNFNLDWAAYIALFDKQGGQCKICGMKLEMVTFCRTQTPNKRSAQIDHDHSTGKIRGVLCRSCNIGIGMFRDNAETMQVAVNYLKGEL